METDGSGAVSSDNLQTPQIDSSRCSGCGRCVAACPQNIITLEVSGYRKHAGIVHPECCTLCGFCLINCPVGAIEG